MKTLRFFLFILAVCLSFTSCRAQRELQELSSIKDIQSVYVGKAMLSLAGASMGTSLNAPGFDGSKLMKNITSIEVVTTQNRKSAKEANTIIDRYLDSHNMEVLTEVSESNEHVLISGETDPASGNMKKILIKVTEPSEFTCVLIKGDIAPELLQEAMK